MSRILIVEDDRMLRRAMRLEIEKQGHEVTEASEGMEGIRIFQAGQVDLVITDLIMPGMEGLETIRELQKLNRSIPIIAITGGGRGSSNQYLRMAQTFGAKVVLEKPFEFRVMFAAIGIALGDG